LKRHIKIKGAYNIRDIGGYRTKDGRSIKWRKLFRAGKLTDIQVEKLEQLKALNVQSICDFRTTTEQQENPDKWFQLEQLNRYSLPIGEGRLDKEDWLKKAAETYGTEQYLYRANRSYVLKNTPQYQAFFELLLDEKNYPLLFHCTAGKDRTGFATVLILSVLGVDQQTIIDDYLLTNQYRKKVEEAEIEEVAAKHGIDKKHLYPLLVVKEEYLKGAYDAIRESYDTMDNFLQQAIGIGELERRQLKRLLVDGS